MNHNIWIGIRYYPMCNNRFQHSNITIKYHTFSQLLFLFTSMQTSVAKASSFHRRRNKVATWVLFITTWSGVELSLFILQTADYSQCMWTLSRKLLGNDVETFLPWNKMAHNKHLSATYPDIIFFFECVLWFPYVKGLVTSDNCKSIVCKTIGMK